MADDAIVKFGAETDGLVKGVDGVKAAMDGLDSTVKRVGQSGAGLGAIFVSAFSVAAIEEFARGIGKVAEEVEKVSSILGVSIEKTSFLGNIGGLMGAPLKDVQGILEAINTAAGTASTDRFSQEAQAFKQLKIDAEQLLETDVDTWLRQIAVSISEFNADMDRAALLTAIGGERLKDLMPVLEKGGKEFDRLAKIVHDSGSIMTTAQQQAFAGVRREFQTFQLYTIGAANALYERLAPAIQSIIAGLTALTDQFTKASKAGGPTSIMLDAIAATGRVAATAVASLVAVVEGLGVAIGALFKLMASKGDIQKAAQGIEGEMTAALTRTAESWKKALQEIWSARPPTQVSVRKGGRDAEGLDTTMREQARMAQEALQAQIATVRGVFDQEKVIQHARVALAQQTAMDGTRAVIDAANRRYEAERALMERQRNLWGQGTVEYERISRQMVQVTQQHATEILRLQAQLALDYKAKFDEVFGALQSSFNSQLRGLLSGTVTWKDAFRNVMADMVVFFIQMIQRMVFEWIAGKAAMLLADTQTAAASAAAQQAAMTATLPARIAKFTSDITSNAAQVFAGIFANMAPLLGPAAAGPAAAGQATVLAQLANVPKFAVGTDFVPYTGLALVHEGEKIVTAEENRMGFGGGSRPSPQVNISAWDGQSVARWLNNGGAETLARAVGGAMRANPSLRPGY